MSYSGKSTKYKFCQNRPCQNIKYYKTIQMIIMITSKARYIKSVILIT